MLWKYEITTTKIINFGCLLPVRKFQPHIECSWDWNHEELHDKYNTISDNFIDKKQNISDPLSTVHVLIHSTRMIQYINNPCNVHRLSTRPVTTHNYMIPQWRGNYSRTGGARPKAPKSALRKSFLRGTRIAFCPKNPRSLKKGLHRNWRVLLPENPAFSKKRKRSSPDLERHFDPETIVPWELWPRIKVWGSKIFPEGGSCPPTSRAYVIPSWQRLLGSVYKRRTHKIAKNWPPPTLVRAPHPCYFKNKFEIFAPKNAGVCIWRPPPPQSLHNWLCSGELRGILIGLKLRVPHQSKYQLRETPIFLEKSIT